MPPLDLLRASPYFQGVAPDALAWLAAHAVRRAFHADETIFLQGEPATGLWMIEHGRVKVYKIGPGGEEHIIHLLSDGQTFADIPALDGGAYPGHAAALTESAIWLLPAEALHAALAAEPELAANVVRLLAARVRTLVEQIEDLALHSVTIRLARFLLKQVDDPALTGVTRVTIAAHLATTPESISRALRALEKTGAIRFDRHRIVIEREDLLRAIAAL